MMNAWVRNCRNILAFMKYKIKIQRERDREENAWRTVKQFSQLKVHYFR